MGVRDIYRNRASLGRASLLPGGIALPTTLPVDNHTVNLFTFSEGSGTTLTDLGFNGSATAVTMTNMTWTQNGITGNSLNTNAATNGNGIFATTIGAVTGSQTMEFVARVRTGCPTTTMFMYAPRTPAYTAFALNAYWLDDGTFVARCRKDATTGILSATSSVGLVVEVWKYIAIVFTASSTLKVYMNGVETASANASTYGALQSTTGLALCGTGETQPGDQQVGLWEFAALRHSDVARTAAEILLNAKLMGFA